MTKKAILTEYQSDVDLTDSFIGQSFKNEITKSLSHNMPEHQTKISPLFQKAVSETDLAQDPVCFYI